MGCASLQKRKCSEQTLHSYKTPILPINIGKIPRLLPIERSTIIRRRTMTVPRDSVRSKHLSTYAYRFSV